VHKPQRTPKRTPAAKQLVDRASGACARGRGRPALADTLGPAFARAIEILAAAKGHAVIVSGVGRSGLMPEDARNVHVDRHASHVPPSGRSLHGDLGIVSRDDVAVVLSRAAPPTSCSASSDQWDVIGVADPRADAVTRFAAGTPGDGRPDASVAEEACPETLAPTASTTGRASR